MTSTAAQVLVVILALAPLIWVARGCVIYAAIAPALAFVAYLIPAVRQVRLARSAPRGTIIAMLHVLQRSGSETLAHSSTASRDGEACEFWL